MRLLSPIFSFEACERGEIRAAFGCCYQTKTHVLKYIACHACMDGSQKRWYIFFLGEEYKIFIMREWGAAANSLKSVLERKLMPFVTLRLKFNKFFQPLFCQAPPSKMKVLCTLNSRNSIWNSAFFSHQSITLKENNPWRG